MKVVVIGLGYVGFPLAILAKQKGHDVFGIDLDNKKIEDIKKGINPVEGTKLDISINASSDGKKEISQADVIIVCVPTPIDKLKNPNLKPVISATKFVNENISDKKPLIVIESTINPGVMEETVFPILKEKHELGKDFYLAHCPERINPGDPVWNVENIPRVLGAFTKEGLDKAYNFYSSILTGKIKKMSTVRAAEATKIVENSFRDINIAFVNELAKSFELLNINIVEVIQGASTKPFAFMPHYPGCGVGGHCIPVDPYYLIEKAKTVGFDHKFLRTARAINNSMPAHLLNRLQDALNEDKKCLNGSKVGLLGLSYKANVGDLRESPALIIKELLERKGAEVITYDPYVKSDVESLEKLQEKTNILVLATNHKEFKNIDFSKVRIFIDGRNMFSQNKPEGIIYRGIGL